MQLALQTDYAMRTLIYLAFRNERITAVEVANFYKISAAHVAKVVNLLSKFGFIRSVRGAGGGIELAKQADQIFVGEVLKAFEGNMHLLECIGVENMCVVQKNCKLKNVLITAEQIQMNYLNGVSLKEILPQQSDLVELSLL